MRPTYEQQEPIWDAREGLVHHGDVPFFECARRLHQALPTSAHARRLVEAMLEQLGDDGRLDPYTDGGKLMVLRSAPLGWWLRRSPAAFYDGAEWNEVNQASDVPLHPRPAEAPAGEPGGPRHEIPRPDIVPDGGRAVLTLWAGDAVVELRYDDEGLLRPDTLFRFGDRWADRRWGAYWPPTVDPTARPPQAPPPSWFVGLPEEPLSVEALAERILATDPSLDPVRVRMNVDAPGGVEGCWFRAKMALRKLAMTEALPTSGGVVVVDAYEHEPEDSCLAVGRTLEEAEAAWLAEERRLRPRPTKPQEEPPPDDDLPDRAAPDRAAGETETVDEDGKKTVLMSTGTMRIAIQPVTRIPWPIPGPQTTPAVAVRYPALPTEVPAAWRDEGFTRWRYLVGESGRIGFALVREEADGFTQVGDGLVEVLDPRGLEAALDAATAAEDPFPWPEPPWLSYPFEHRHYTAWSNLRQAPTPPVAAGASWNREWNWRDMDGDLYRWRITRMRRR